MPPALHRTIWCRSTFGPRGPGLSNPTSFLRPALPMAPIRDDNARDERSVPRPNPATFLRDFALYMTTKYAISRKRCLNYTAYLTVIRQEFPFGNMVKNPCVKKIAAGKRLILLLFMPISIIFDSCTLHNLRVIPACSTFQSRCSHHILRHIGGSTSHGYDCWNVARQGNTYVMFIGVHQVYVRNEVYLGRMVESGSKVGRDRWWS